MFNNPLTLTDPTGMFSWRGFLQTFGQVLNIVAIFVPQLQVFAQIFNGIMAYANGGLKGGLLNAFTSMIPGLNSVPGIWDNIGNLAISAAVGGASAMVMGGRFKEGAIGSLKSAAISMTLGAIAQGAKSRQTGGKNRNGADTASADEAVTTTRASPSQDKVVTVITPENSAQFSKIATRLHGRQFGSWEEANSAFAEAFLPFTEQTGLEVGANLTKQGQYYLEDFTLGTRMRVNVPVNSSTYYELHTHPVGRGEGFSGYLVNKNGKTFSYLDYNSTWQHAEYASNIQGAIVHKAGSNRSWIFNYLGYRNAVANGSTYVDAKTFTREMK